MPKSPWQYAVEYVKATNREQQIAALDGCPPEWRDLVRATIRNMRDMDQLRKRRDASTDAD